MLVETEDCTSDGLTFAELATHLQVPTGPLLALLRDGDRSFPALSEDPASHHFTSREVEEIAQFRDVLRLPYGNPFEGLSSEQRNAVVAAMSEYTAFDEDE
jgi:hypothetical protein